MAKKPLRFPELPKGHRRKFFVLLHHQVLLNGDMSVAALGREIGVSHQTIYKALTGPSLPSRSMVIDLATYFGKPDPDRLIEEMLGLWMQGVKEERSIVQTVAEAETGHNEGADSQGVEPNATENLTERETIILRYLPTMLKAGEIAADLFVSVNTVKAHQQSIYRKLGVSSRREAVERARAGGLL